MSSDLTIYQGTSMDVRFIASSGGSPVPLTGREARMQVRKRVGGTIALDVSTDDSLTVEPDDATGQIALHLTATQTRAITLPGNSGLYAVLAYLTADPEDVLLIAKGRVILDVPVTELD